MLTTPFSTEASPFAPGELGLPGSPGHQAAESSNCGTVPSFDETLLTLVDEQHSTSTPSETPQCATDLGMPSLEWLLAELATGTTPVPSNVSELPEPDDVDGDELTPSVEDCSDGDEVSEHALIAAAYTAPKAHPAGPIETAEPPAAVAAGVSAGIAAGVATMPSSNSAEHSARVSGIPLGPRAGELPGAPAVPTGAGPDREESAGPAPLPPSGHVPEDAGQAMAPVPHATGSASPSVDTLPETSAPAAAEASGKSVAIPAPARTPSSLESKDAAPMTSELHPEGQATPAADDVSGEASSGEQKPANQRMTQAARRFSARLEGLTEPSERRQLDGALAPRGASDGLTGEVRTPVAPRVPLAAAATTLIRAAEPAPETLGRLIQAIRVQTRDGVSEATVRLQPEHLGEVTIAIRVGRGAVSAVVHAEAASVCEWLRSQEESIRSGLSEQGLQLERFVVQRDRPRERREAPPQSQARPRARRGDGPDVPRFDVAA